MKPIVLGVLVAALAFPACSADLPSGNTDDGSGGKTSTSAAGGATATGTGGSGSGGASSNTGGSARGTGGDGMGGAPGGTAGRSSGRGNGGAAGRTAGRGGSSAPGGSSATGGSSVTIGGRGGTTGPVLGGAGGGSTGPSDAGSTSGDDAGVGEDGGPTEDGGTLSSGCGKAMTRPNPRTQQTITVGTATRYYLLDVPSSADNKTPLMLIFALHGYDMNNVSVVGLFNFTSRSGGKAITVYPQGEGPAPGDTSHWGDGVLKSTWNGNDANYNFIRDLMTDLESRYCIDTSRVFITGFSMGGMFTNSIACAHNDWFRGFAPVEGMGPGSCQNKDAIPAIIIHQGTGDTLVTPSSGGEPTRDFWLKQNGCSQTNTSAFTGCKSYGDCAEPVVYCVGNWDHTINATISGNVWSFFSGLP